MGKIGIQGDRENTMNDRKLKELKPISSAKREDITSTKQG